MARVTVCVCVYVIRGLGTYNLRVYNNNIIVPLTQPSLTNGPAAAVVAWRGKTRLTDYIRPTHERANPPAVTFCRSASTATTTDTYIN